MFPKTVDFSWYSPRYTGKIELGKGCIWYDSWEYEKASAINR